MAANNPSIANDPHAYLSAYIALEPSRDALIQLSGTVATFVQENEDPTTAVLYLSAVARHMGTSAPMGDAMGAQRNQILEAIGVAATKCTPRSTISQSGILPALARWMNASPSVLTGAHTEFLQCSILAAQYRFARRMCNGEWPRPVEARNGNEQTLRYYYLRGLVEMGNEEWQWAVRAFWTCLSIPVEGVSAIAINAWKKMVYCQLLLGIPTSLPSAISNSMTRFLTTQREGEAEHISAYRNVIKAFQTKNQVEFTALFQTHAAVWQADGTTGMMERLAIQLLHNRVCHLASVYSVISMEQLARELAVEVGTLPLLLQKVEGLTVEMDGEWLSLKLKETPQLQNGSTSLEQLMYLTERIRAMDLSIASSARYQHLKDGSGNVASARANLAGPLGVAEL